MSALLGGSTQYIVKSAPGYTETGINIPPPDLSIRQTATFVLVIYAVYILHALLI